jgi:FG-GAP repeat
VSPLDGIADFAVFRPQSASWFVDTNQNGGTDIRVFYGQGSDVPVPGDFDGDGITDFAVFRPASGKWFVDTNRNGGTDLSVVFGRSGDMPLREGGWILTAAASAQ